MTSLLECKIKLLTAFCHFCGKYDITAQLGLFCICLFPHPLIILPRRDKAALYAMRLHETLKLKLLKRQHCLNHDAHQAHSCVLSTELKKRPVIFNLHRFRNVSPGNCYFLRPRWAHHLNEEGYPSASLAGYTLQKITMVSGDVFGLGLWNCGPTSHCKAGSVTLLRPEDSLQKNFLTLNATAAVTN